MPAFIPIDPDEICRRWHQATVANNLLQWRALSHLLAAEAKMCKDAGLHGTGEAMCILSGVARQRSLDLQPGRETTFIFLTGEANPMRLDCTERRFRVAQPGSPA